MKAICNLSIRRILWRRFLLAVFLVLGLAGSSFAQSTSGEGGDPAIIWTDVHEISSISYSKADSARRSYQFYALDENRLPITLEQSHRYAYLWDFGNGRMSIDASPVMIFEHDVPDSIVLRVTALKQSGGPIRNKIIYRPREESCDTTGSFKMDRMTLRRGRVTRDETQPSIRIHDPGYKPVPGKCINYLLEITFPTRCELGASITVNGFAPGTDPASPNQLTIKNVVADPAIRVTPTGQGSLRLQAGTTSDVTYQVLLQCEVGADAPIKQNVRWLVSGVFEPQPGNTDCRRTVVPLDVQYELVGSLDPSKLECLNRRPIHTGDTAYWHLTIENGGNLAEDLITVASIVPASLDFEQIQATKCLWADSVILVIPERGTINRQVKWNLGAENGRSLKPGQVVDLYFQAPVTGYCSCPKRRCLFRHRDTHSFTRIDHRVTITFSLADKKTKDEVASNDDLKLLCHAGRLYKIKKSRQKHDHAPKLAAGASKEDAKLVAKRSATPAESAPTTKR